MLSMHKALHPRPSFPTLRGGGIRFPGFASLSLVGDFSYEPQTSLIVLLLLLSFER